MLIPEPRWTCSETAGSALPTATSLPNLRGIRAALKTGAEPEHTGSIRLTPSKAIEPDVSHGDSPVEVLECAGEAIFCARPGELSSTPRPVRSQALPTEVAVSRGAASRRCRAKDASGASHADQAGDPVDTMQQALVPPAAVKPVRLS